YSEMEKIIVILLALWSGGLGRSISSVDPSTAPQEMAVPGQALHSIEGLILQPSVDLNLDSTWLTEVTLSVNGGEFMGFPRLDGRFTINGLPNGTHILEVLHPDISFLDIKLEITAKGKYRARRVSYVQPWVIDHIPSPLRLLPIARRRFFHERQQWSIVDFVLNPMVLIMTVPLMLLLIVPRIINDPEAKKEIENIHIPKINDMPDLGDLLSSFLSGSKAPEAILPPPPARP
ncbi:hypothetical protein KR018_006566, partial [Drosophila ironensis]